MITYVPTVDGKTVKLSYRNGSPKDIFILWDEQGKENYNLVKVNRNQFIHGILLVTETRDVKTSMEIGELMLNLRKSPSGLTLFVRKSNKDTDDEPYTSTEETIVLENESGDLKLEFNCNLITTILNRLDKVV